MSLWPSPEPEDSCEPASGMLFSFFGLIFLRYAEQDGVAVLRESGGTRMLFSFLGLILPRYERDAIFIPWPDLSALHRLGRSRRFVSERQHADHRLRS